MDISGYLQGKVGVEVPDEAITSLLYDRNVSPDADITDVDARTRELCVADLYMWCSTMPSTTGRVEDADGEWRHVEGGSSLTANDKSDLRRLALSIYKKYGENHGVSGIRMKSMGIMTWKANL